MRTRTYLVNPPETAQITLTVAPDSLDRRSRLDLLPHSTATRMCLWRLDWQLYGQSQQGWGSIDFQLATQFGMLQDILLEDAGRRSNVPSAPRRPRSSQAASHHQRRRYLQAVAVKTLKKSRTLDACSDPMAASPPPCGAEKAS